MKKMKLYKFQADWCSGCKVLSATMDKVDIPHTVIDVNVDDEFKLVKDFNIRGLPTLVLLNDEGDEVERFSGAMQAAEFSELFVTPYV